MNNIDGLSDEQVGDALVAVLYEEGDAVDIELREFRAEVGNEFLQMERVRVHRNLDPVVFRCSPIRPQNSSAPKA
jgi:hypothetical protein